MVLGKYILDQHPIMLLEHCVDYGPTPFRVFHSLFMMDCFDDIVCDSWSTTLEGEHVDNTWVIFNKNLQLLIFNL